MDPRRSLIKTVVRYLESVEDSIPPIIRERRRHETLHNQRGRLLGEVVLG